jgi:hypothetical protein
MPKHSVKGASSHFLLLLALSVLVSEPGEIHGQSATNIGADDKIQQSYDWRLKGLPRVEIIRYKYEEDYVFKASTGAVTSDELTKEIEVVLRRYHMPLLPMSPSAVSLFKPRVNVGSLLLIPAYDSKVFGNQVAASLTLHLELEEPASLKRDPSAQVNAVMWDDSVTIDSPQTDPRNRIFDAISRLARNFALAYLAANQK